MNKKTYGWNIVSKASQITLGDQLRKCRKTMTRRRVEIAAGAGFQKFLTTLSFGTRARSPTYPVVRYRAKV